MMRTLCAFYGCLLITGTTQAGRLNIVATGDSNTTGYAPIRLTLAMQAQGISGTGYSIASGGSTATLYVGKALDTNHKPEPAFHNQAEEAINGPVYGFGAPWTYGSVIEPNPEPDAVIVMLGTNDAIQAVNAPSVWTTYQTEMTEVFSYLSSAVTPSGKRPDIFIATPLPLLAPQYAAADAFLDNTVAPWLRDQVVYWQGQDAAVHLIDVRNDIQQQPNWQSWYSDGIHLFPPGQLGYEWLAREVLNAVLDQHRGDANLDGVVDGLDYVAWSDRFGQPGNWSQGDFNHDGFVDGLDYTAWADHFAPGIPAVPKLVPVPESAGIAMAGLGALTIALCLQRFGDLAGRRSNNLRCEL
jgi:lysophospholipase L1-like esterase